MTLRLDIRQHQQLCVIFSLSWGKGQWCSAELPYPDLLMQQYQTWQKSYLNFYRHLSDPPAPPPPDTPQTTLRGRVNALGSFAAVEDWRSNLVQAEAQLLAEFHRWLSSSQLADIRKQLAQVVRQSSERAEVRSVDVFLTCNSSELERLPWETWEIMTEFATSVVARIVRAPKTIRSPATAQIRRTRPRILVILGDDTGLDFQVDRAAVTSLSTIAEVQFVGWQPGRDPQALLVEIARAIADERGWDVLFFAGHSNEAPTTGGKLAIAPGVTLSISEIAPQLTLARERGLQFALFNSCNGLNLAESLIDLGFSQVAVMREPIHNRVAQEFLLQFLRSLSAHQDVHESLLSACQLLKLERNLTYPSAYLIPSLFRHPEAELFRIKPTGFKQWLQQWLPSRRQAIALAGLSLLSLLLPVQGHLLERRVWTQALYRRATGQVTAAVPPIWLVQIDDQSIRQAKISEPNPMDRSYLAALINQAVKLDAKVIGVDYLLDRPASQPAQDQKLAATVQSAIQQSPPPWLVFATIRDHNGKWAELMPEVANPNWSLLGNMHLLLLGQLPMYVPLIDPSLADSIADSSADSINVSPQNHSQIQTELYDLPLSYLAALSYQLKSQTRLDLPQPDLQHRTSFAAEVSQVLHQQGQDITAIFSKRAQTQPVTEFFYGFNQMWLHPIIDFSIPPEQVYRPIPAWEFLQQNSLSSVPASQPQPLPIVMIVPGGYSEAGLSSGQDNLELPAAVRHWRYWQPDRTASLTSITGGEVHAYLLQEFLTQRLVIPVPDFWMIGLAALSSRALALRLSRRRLSRQHQGMILLGIPIIYGLISLQLYLSAAILLPWLFPSTVFWVYLLPGLRKQSSEVRS